MKLQSLFTGLGVAKSRINSTGLHYLQCCHDINSISLELDCWIRSTKECLFDSGYAYNYGISVLILKAPH